MTLDDIIVSALEQVECNPVSRANDKYAAQFRQYANEAVMDIADSFRLFHTDTVTVTGNTFDIQDLSRPCTKIMSIAQGGKPIAFDDGDSSGEILVGCDGDVTVKYRYVPIDMSSDSDRPDIPEYLHRLIVLYVIARYRSGGDASVQGAAGIFYSVYNEQKRKMMRHSGAPENYKLKNIY